MADNRLANTGMILAIVVSAVIGVGGMVYGITGREIAFKVDTGLAHDSRLRFLEQKESAHEVEYRAIMEKLDTIQGTLKELRK